jgi:hypothetical protein
MTYRIHPEGRVGGAQLSLNASSAGVEPFWKAVAAWHAWLPDYADAGGNTVEYMVSASALTIFSMTLPDRDAASVDELVAPLLAELDGLGID